MRFTKYPQSCAIIEGDDGGRLLIDPGNVAMDAVAFRDFGTVDAVLFTHRHADHFDPRALEAIAERELPVYANADVCGLVPSACTTVTDGMSFTAAGMTVVAHDMPHVTMVNGAAGPPNTGFVFDGRLLHPGDSMAVDGVRVDAIAVPIAGPDVSYRDAYVAIETTGARRAVPIHYDVFPGDPRVLAKYCDIAEIIALDSGETAEI